MVNGLGSLLAQQNSATAASSNSSNSTNAPSTGSLDEGLDPNSFITLLTAQLKAQDPLDPMDPDQMVSELTSMNTLQQTIQMRQDLDSLLSAASPSGSTPSGSGSSTPAGTNSASTNATAAQRTTADAYRSTAAIANTNLAAGAAGIQQRNGIQ